MHDQIIINLSNISERRKNSYIDWADAGGNKLILADIEFYTNEEDEPEETPIPTDTPAPTDTRPDRYSGSDRHLAPDETPEPSGTPISVIGATVTKTETDQEYIFDVELEQPHDNCNVYVAIYDENHCLIAVRIASLDTTKKRVSQ